MIPYDILEFLVIGMTYLIVLLVGMGIGISAANQRHKEALRDRPRFGLLKEVNRKLG